MNKFTMAGMKERTGKKNAYLIYTCIHISYVIRAASLRSYNPFSDLDVDQRREVPVSPQGGQRSSSQTVASLIQLNQALNPDC